MIQLLRTALLEKQNYLILLFWVALGIFTGPVAYLAVLNNRISKFVKKGRLFSNFSVKILTHYDSLYKKGFWRIKGFNYLFKQLWEKV